MDNGKLLPGKLDNLCQGQLTLAEACVSAYSYVGQATRQTPQ